MSAKSIVLVAIGVVSFYCATIWAHTESEYLNMARNMIGTLQSLDWECEEELLERQESNDPLYHWNYTSQDDFFGFFVTNDGPELNARWPLTSIFPGLAPTTCLQ